MTTVVRSTDNTDLVAIVGVSCRLPGAPDMVRFAKLLSDGVDAVDFVPADRWTQSLYQSPATDQRGKSYTFAAGCLDDVAGFDAEYFGISPREAVQVDPQQRLMLELALEALEDAGFPPASLAGQSVGVYAGGSSADYSTLRMGDIGVADAYFMTGISLCSLSNRISYAFDLQGPSLTVDTACSSSLVALHLACKALASGEISTALVGSANLLLTPHSFVGFSQASMLSKRGRCQAFDASADGYVRAEGGGMLVLKRLNLAMRDGDEIHAVIRATAVNSDGRTTGLSRPSEESQEELLRGIYRRAGVNAAELDYVEAHGTGTQIGDPVEATALGEALGKARGHKLPIGSVKTNLGHLEAASGIAGLLKLVVALRTRTVPASLHFKTPNPNIPFEELNLQVVSEPLALSRSDRLVMGINSFGFGGTNAHAILESAPRSDVQPASAKIDPPPMLLLSAASAGALNALAGTWSGLIGDHAADPAALGALMRGAARHREEYTQRVTVIGHSGAALQDGIASFLSQRSAHAVIESTALRDPGKLAFVFSGNGSQWQGMGRHAAKTNAPFHAAVVEVDAILQPLLGWSILEMMFDEENAWLGRTDIEQPMLFALQVAVVKALRASGVEAHAFAGHSVGEVAAAWAAGALSLEDAARVIFERSRHQAASSGVGGMAVLGTSAAEAQKILLDWPALTIAAINARTSVTIAGPLEALEALGTRAEALKLSFVQLDIGHAFHSVAMEPVRAPLLAALGGLRPLAPTRLFASSVTGAPVTKADLGADYWWQNVRQTVQFAGALQTLIQEGVRVVIEIGPQPILQSFIKDAFDAADVQSRSLPSLTRRNQSVDPILVTAARSHGTGHSIAGGPLFEGVASWRELPHYPWQKQRFWTDRTEEATDHIFLPTTHLLLGFQPEASRAAWFNHLDLNAQPWLGDHKVDGVAVLPAAAILDMALAAARDSFPEAPGYDIFDVEIRRPLVLEPDITRHVNFSAETTTGHFSLSSRPRLSGQAAVVHATGRIAASASAGTSHFPDLSLESAASTEIAPEEVYQITSAHGLQYGPSFRAIAGISVLRPDQAIVRLRATSATTSDDRFVIDPTLLDGAFQGLVALAPDTGERVTVLPIRFGRVRLLSAQMQPVRADVFITSVGPRSICANFMLYSQTGLPILELRDCWFSMLNAEHGSHKSDHLIRPIRIPLPAGSSLAPPPLVLPPLLGAAAAQESSEHGLLMEAFLSATVYEHLSSRFSADVIVTPEMIQGAGIRPELFGRVMPWLEQDGLALRDGGDWQLTSVEDFPGSATLFDSFFFEGSGDSAELALVAQIGFSLGNVLHGQDLPRPPDIFVEQMIGAGRASKALLDRLETAFLEVVAAWPAGRPLRILELDSGCPLTTRLLPLLQNIPSATYHIVTRDSNRLAAAQEALAGLSEFGIRLFDAEAEESGEFDLVVGAFLFSRDRELARHAARAVAGGGLLLLVDGMSNRLWEAAELLGSVLDGISIESGAWLEELTSLGYENLEAEPVVTPVWPGCLVRARRPLVAAPVPVFEKAVFICDIAAQSGVALGAAGHSDTAIPAGLRSALLEQLPIASFGDGTALAGILRDSSTNIVILMLPSLPVDASAEAMAYALNCVAQSVQSLAMSDNVSVWLTVRGGEQGDPWVEAVAGLRRVLANEMSNITCRFVLFGASLDDAAVALRLRLELSMTDLEDDIAWTTQGRSGLRLLRGLPVVSEKGPVRLVIRRPGLIDTLTWASDAGDAPLRADEVVVEVTAAGVNFRDLMWSLGLLPDEALLGGFVGATLGLECAGTVTAVGSEVTQLVPGMRVMGFAPASFASHARATARALVPIPDHLSDVQAATIPIAYLTAVYALGTLAQIAPGERVLIHASAGGVGLAALQYALHRGAEVFATAGSPAKRAVLQFLGVQHIFDSRSLTFVDEVMAATNGEGVDIVLNSLSGAAMERSLLVLRPFGRFLELGKRDLYGDTQVGLRPFRNNISYFAIDVDKLPLQRPKMTETILQEIQTLLQTGELRPLPSHIFDFGDVTEAFRLMQSGTHLGKIVLQIGKKAIKNTPPPWAADPAGVYLLTGAVSGFGGEVAKWLVDHGARHLAVISRRGATDPQALRLVEACAEQGAAVDIYSGDVADEASLKSALAEIRANGKPLIGILHAAAVLDDGLLPAMDASRFAKAIGPKLIGAALLDKLTRSDPIQLFLLFSSIAALLGNPGQANYVAANAAIEGIARRRRAQGLPAVSVGWAPISDAGMLSRNTAVGEMLTSVTGAKLLTAQDALSDLSRILAADVPVVIQAPIDFGSAGSHGMLPLLRSATFRQWARTDEATPREIHLPTVLAGMSYDEAVEYLADILMEQIAQITRISASRLSKETFLGDIGMDSLMMVELRLTLEQRYGVVVPMLQLAEETTAATLARRLVQSLLTDSPSDVEHEMFSRHEGAAALELASDAKVESGDLGA